jgi:hypothetical protein
MHLLIKAAFLTYYLRLSPNRVFRLWIGVGFGINFGSFMISLLIFVFQCVPVSAALTTLGRLRAQCMDREFVLFAPSAIVRLLESTAIAHTNASQNVVLDIFVFVLPIPILAKLQMPRRKKIGVMAVFSFGAGSVIMSIIRHHSLLRIINIQTTSSGLGEVLIVVALEINLAAIAVNLPAIRSIWVKRSHDRKKEMLAGKYGGTTARSQTVDTLGPGRPRQMHEMSQLSNTARDSPLSDSQEDLWRTTENADGNVPCQHKKVSRHEQFTTVEL